MLRKQPLSRRILLSFVLLTIVISGLFAWAIIAVVHVVEEELVGQELIAEMVQIEKHFREDGQLPDVVGGGELFVPTMRAQAIPTAFINLPKGYNEVVTPNGAWHVVATEIDGTPFILARNQDAFEAREQTLYKVVIGGGFLSVALSLLIGWLTAYRVIDPVVRLARQVRNRDQLLPLAPPLASDYASDEVGQLAQAFDLAMSQLRTLVERERLFTADVSHELRTPLMIVATSAELLERAELGQRERRQVERITKAAGEMRELVETFLQLARSHTAALPTGESVTLAEMAIEQAAYWGDEISQRGLAFHWQVEEENPQRWHRTLLRVVMGNLLRNALHYTEQGEIRLTVGATGFRIEDTGPGIPESERESLFQPFVRGSGARGEGLGLGLSLVKRVCEIQGWSISAGNRPGGGSRFEVTVG